MTVNADFSSELLSEINDLKFRGELMFSNILVAVDGSEHAKQALRYAAGLSKLTGGQLTIVHVKAHSGSDRIPEDINHYAQTEHVLINEAQILEQVAQSILAEAKTHASSQGAQKVETLIESGKAAERILELCKTKKIDLVVLGRRGLGDIASLLMGSVSHKVVQLAVCPCLTVPIATPSLGDVT